MSSPSVVVTLVHGTVLLARWPWLARTARRLGTLWPSRARGEIEWHQEGSTFRRRLPRAMGDECCVTDFDWPGANTEWERLCDAGAEGDFSDARRAHLTRRRCATHRQDQGHLSWRQTGAGRPQPTAGTSASRPCATGRRGAPSRSRLPLDTVRQRPVACRFRRPGGFPLLGGPRRPWRSALRFHLRRVPADPGTLEGACLGRRVHSQHARLGRSLGSNRGAKKGDAPVGLDKTNSGRRAPRARAARRRR